MQPFSDLSGAICLIYERTIGLMGAATVHSAGFGLFNVRERLMHLDGEFQLESKPGQGTKATLIATIKDQAETC